MSEELLPCPFCGWCAEMRRDESSDYERNWSWYVSCINDGCGGQSLYCKEQDEAVAQWNKRPDHVPEMDRLKMAFMEWLRIYENIVTRRWEWLSVTECDTLGEMQWLELAKEYDAFTGKRQREQQP